jgi:AmmeMemoRadiSam system protein B
MVREPCVAGQFYEKNAEKLEKQLLDCYTSKYGPGDLPVKRTDKKITAIIAPHAGYQFSGPCAAWAYKEIAESKFPYAFILLGPNHFGTGSGISIEDWKTPLGVVKTDKKIAEELSEHTSLKIAEHEHAAEHSLEVQLPFLQFSNKDKIDELKIVPITIGQDIDFMKLGKELADYFKKCNKEVVFIISSDFTHYGPGYHYLPFTTDVPSRISKLDKGAIELILKLDTNGFRDYVNKTLITICGYMPILVYLAMTSEMQMKITPKFLMHYTSGDILGDFKNSVSYAAIQFR